LSHFLGRKIYELPELMVDRECYNHFIYYGQNKTDERRRFANLQKYFFILGVSVQNQKIDDFLCGQEYFFFDIYKPSIHCQGLKTHEIYH
jgi:hypothetical protein